MILEGNKSWDYLLKELFVCFGCFVNEKRRDYKFFAIFYWFNIIKSILVKTISHILLNLYADKVNKAL